MSTTDGTSSPRARPLVCGARQQNRWQVQPRLHAQEKRAHPQRSGPQRRRWLPNLPTKLHRLN